jgi:ribosomal protein S18 acetylase RimI-like enzyme
MAVVLQQVGSSDQAKALELLHVADEDDNRILDAMRDSANATYIAFDGPPAVGAAVMRWQGDEAEIVYIAVTEEVRGLGYGKKIINALITQARMRDIRYLLVGTANSGIGNIAFYQKCGFRMDHVRRDYFSYFAQPIMEDGILIRDMLVFRMELD